MNIRGIELLRATGLPGPRGEVVFADWGAVDLDRLYACAARGATILAFDHAEPLNQNPLFEKDEREYAVNRNAWVAVVEYLAEKMIRKGVAERDIIFLTHQTYLENDVCFAGRAAFRTEWTGAVEMWLDMMTSTRPGHKDFIPDFTCSVPVMDGRPLRTSAQNLISRVEFPWRYLVRIADDAQPFFARDPCVDFSVYAKTGAIFYSDLFFTK